jgi:transposase
LSFAERLEIQDRVRAGERFEAVAEAMGCSAKSVQRLLTKTGGIAPRAAPRSSRRLAPAEREEISLGLGAGESARSIAARLGRSTSTITHEVNENGGRDHYRAWMAQERSHERAR